MDERNSTRWPTHCAQSDTQVTSRRNIASEAVQHHFLFPEANQHRSAFQPRRTEIQAMTKHERLQDLLLQHGLWQTDMENTGTQGRSTCDGIKTHRAISNITRVILETKIDCATSIPNNIAFHVLLPWQGL